MSHYIAFNTCVSCESGLATNIRRLDNIEEGAYIWNNLVHSIDDNVGYFLAYTPNGFAWAHNNLFWDENNFNVYWGQELSSLASWNIAGNGSVYENINSAPLLVNTLTTYPNRDYRLQTNSPAASFGASTSADGTDPFALYLQRYGMNISRDVTGKTRTVPYSMGAYE